MFCKLVEGIQPRFSHDISWDATRQVFITYIFPDQSKIASYGPVLQSKETIR